MSPERAPQPSRARGRGRGRGRGASGGHSSGPARPRAAREAPEVREARMARRRALVPQVTYPEDLPVVARKEDIATAIRDHQVVIVAGETGSGKTTQIPKICLELGRGIEGTIGHTQPR